MGGYEVGEEFHFLIEPETPLRPDEFGQEIQVNPDGTANPDFAFGLFNPRFFVSIAGTSGMSEFRLGVKQENGTVVGAVNSARSPGLFHYFNAYEWTGAPMALICTTPILVIPVVCGLPTIF